MDAMELYLENIGDDNAPLVCAMGEEYTTAEIKKIILDTICLLGEEGGEDAEVNEKVLLRLLAFVSMEPVPSSSQGYAHFFFHAITGADSPLHE